MVSLVTGAGGFIGSCLALHLTKHGHRVARYSRSGMQSGDILDGPQVTRSVAGSRPDWIFHLAAQSLPRVSWEDPARTFDVNVNGTINLLDAVRSGKLDPVIVVVCSSSEYESSDRPISEDGAMGPTSPYAISKLAEDHIARTYGLKYALKIIRVRPFFITGPGKVGDVCSDLARRIVALERTRAKPVIDVGNVNVVRDFVDVRDAVDALALIAERGVAGEVYNICSGQGRSIADVIAAYRRIAGLAFETRVSPALVRPIDEMIKVGDASKLRSLGWVPRMALDETFHDILEYWRGKERDV